MSRPATDLKFIRDTMLRALERFPRGMNASAIRTFLGSSGISLSPDEVAAEIRYLADKGLIVSDAAAHTPAAANWRLGAFGRDHLDSLSPE